MSLTAINAALSLQDVSASEKLILIVLANYADENMSCYPSQKRIAFETCFTDRTIRSVLSALEGRGFISRKMRNRSDGSRTSDVITLTFPGCVATGPEDISEVVETVSTSPRKMTAKNPEINSGLTTFEPFSEPPSEPARVRRPSKRVPADWSPSFDDMRVGRDLGMSEEAISFQLATMRDHEFGTARSDWSATFRNWLRRSAPKQQQQRPLDLGFI